VKVTRDSPSSRTAEKLQAASARHAPGKSSGPKGNEHSDSEQILFAIEGEMLAEVREENALLRRGDCVIVRRGMAHKFTSHAGSDAVTFNVYEPPAYDAEKGR
jgi:mannose-6-phosphate isomerase-like protein (cupin superfamily)